MANNELLKIEGISKSFPGVKVLDGISVTFKKGSVHALLGENGAGKSTFMNILFGYYHADEGKLIWDGQEVRLNSPIAAQSLGISMIHQENSLIPYLSVMNNIYLGNYPKKGPFVNKRELRKNVEALLAELEITDIQPDTQVDKLSVAQKQLIEIVKALSLKPKLLMMDEPTAALTSKETQTLMKIIARLRESGVSIVYVSHRMEEVFEIADEISVLRDGKLITTKQRGEITIDEAVRLMVGRDLGEQMSRFTDRGFDYKTAETIIQVRNLTRKGKFQDVSFDVKKGEILGFGGLVGAGRSELMEALFGYDRYDSGYVEISGKAMNIRHPHDAIASGMAMVPEERKVKGIFPELSVRDNINIASYKGLKKGAFISGRLEAQSAQKYVQQLSIKTTSVKKKIGKLSGGNQQKAILSRWLQTKPDILILDEPTHGIDVGAKADIYRIIRDLADQGITILLISSELPELLLMSDRIVVMHNGTVSGVVSKEEFSQERVMRFATGQINA